MGCLDNGDESSADWPRHQLDIPALPLRNPDAPQVTDGCLSLTIVNCGSRSTRGNRCILLLPFL